MRWQYARGLRVENWRTCSATQFGVCHGRLQENSVGRPGARRPKSRMGARPVAPATGTPLLGKACATATPCPCPERRGFGVRGCHGHQGEGQVLYVLLGRRGLIWPQKTHLIMSIAISIVTKHYHLRRASWAAADERETVQNRQQLQSHAILPSNCGRHLDFFIRDTGCFEHVNNGRHMEIRDKLFGIIAGKLTGI